VNSAFDEPSPTGEIPVSPAPNPFATRFVSPQRNRYVFADGQDVRSVAERLSERLLRQRAAAIVGPHGTGKSTLLNSLVPRLREYFADIVWVRLTPGTDRASQVQQVKRAIRPSGMDPAFSRQVPPSSQRSEAASPSTETPVAAKCVVVDGFEQLGWVTRGWLTACVRSSKTRWQFGSDRPPSLTDSRAATPHLLITCHAPQIGIPTFLTTRWDDDLVERLTQEKLERLPRDQQTVMNRAARSRSEAIRRSGHSRRNVRDYWFALYDDYERLCRQTDAITTGPRGHRQTGRASG